MRCRVHATGRKAGPVVKIDDAYVALRTDYAVAAVDFHVKHLTGSLTYIAHMLFVKHDSCRLAVDSFVTIL